MLTAFLERHIPASTIAKPAFIKITKIVAIKSHKLLARKGKLVQEVFLVTDLKEGEIKELIKETNPSYSRKKKIH